jgi:DNA repair protein RadD
MEPQSGPSPDPATAGLGAGVERFAGQRDVCPNTNFSWSLQDRGLFSEARTLRPLRPHQQRAIDAIRGSLAAGHRRPMLQAPTGFGKTLTAAHIIARALDRGNRVIFTVPALSLVDQTVAAFECEGIDCVGVMQSDHERTDRAAPVQICSVQTLARRQKPDAALVIVDEAHLSFKSVHDWMADPAWAKVPFIGLSATPWTRGLGNHYDDLIIATTTKELIDQGYLSKFVVFAPSAPDLSAVSTVAGEFHQGELAEAVDQPPIVGDVVDTWLKRGENRPTLVYGVNRAHARHLEQRFAEAGIPSAYVDAFTERDEREKIFRRFRANDVRVICNVATLAVGLDLDVRCIVDARPTKSEMRFVQTIGRGLRTAPGKENLVILDHAGNHLRLGMVTDIHHEKLDVGCPRRSLAERARRVPLPRLCEACTAVLPRGAMVCSACGKVREAPNTVIAEDGELVALGSGQSSARAPTAADQYVFLGELRGLARERGYREGWVAHKFRERFNTWPNDPRVRHAPPMPASLRTRNWVKARQIAYAKASKHG